MYTRFVALFALVLLAPSIGLASSHTAPTFTDREGNTFTDVRTESCGLFGMFTCVNDDRFTTREGGPFESGTVLTDFSRVDEDGNVIEERRSRSSINAETDSLADYIVRIGVFINVALLPFLFGIALLVFLFNIVRYYINRDNVDERERAQRVAIYGIAAFVFLVSLWGIVNLFVGGLGFDREASLCPDYLGNWCQDRSYSGSFTPQRLDRVPTGSYEGTPALVDFGCGSGVDLDDCPQDTNEGLAELVFGEYQDATRNTSDGNLTPRAVNNTVTIPASATCIDGVQTLQQAANIESTQAAYLFVRDTTGNSRWVNVTDQNSQESVSFDSDAITAALTNSDPNAEPLLIHTHAKQRTEAARLATAGHAPSAADYRVMCENALSGVTFAVADGSQVWQYSHNAALACPRTREEQDQLELIEVVFNLSKVAAGDRTDEFVGLLNSDLIDQTQRNLLNPLAGTQFNSLSSGAIRNLVASDLADLGLQSFETTPANVCSSI